MAQLKDRNRQIPGGLTFIQPETGWQPTPWSSFDRIVQQLQQHRRGNPWLAQKHKWPLDQPGIALEVDAYNSKLCEAHGWHDFIVSGGAGEAPPNWSPPQRPQEEGLAVGGAKRTMAGVKLVRDWLGSGLKPVDRGLATKRAAICVNCPLNRESVGFWQNLSEQVAREIKTLKSIKSDMELKTDYDDRLKMCWACECVNELKVHTPLAHVIKNLSAAAKSNIVNGMVIDGQLVKAKDCWILAEELAGG